MRVANYKANLVTLLTTSALVCLLGELIGHTPVLLLLSKRVGALALLANLSKFIRVAFVVEVLGHNCVFCHRTSSARDPSVVGVKLLQNSLLMDFKHMLQEGLLPSELPLLKETAFLLELQPLVLIALSAMVEPVFALSSVLFGQIHCKRSPAALLCTLDGLMRFR